MNQITLPKLFNLGDQKLEPKFHSSFYITDRRDRIGPYNVTDMIRPLYPLRKCGVLHLFGVFFEELYADDLSGIIHRY